MNDTDRLELAKELADVCRLTGHFVLRSGVTSNVYFDKYQFEARPRLLARVGAALLPLVPEGTALLGGLELGGVPIATVLSSLTDLPMALIRKHPKEYGTRRLAEGADVAGRVVTLVEDVITSGGQVLLSATALREKGAVVRDVICVIDREAGGREALAAEQLELHALFLREEIDRFG